MIRTGFVEAMRGRLFGARKEPASVTIAALEQEYAGVTPVELASYDYRPSQDQIDTPTFRMSKQAIEITNVPGASKSKGEALTAHFVFTPVSGPAKVMALNNVQTEEAIGPGGKFRFTFPPVAAAQVFMDTGKGLLYAKGTGEANGEHKWVYGVEVSCFVPSTMRDLNPPA